MGWIVGVRNTGAAPRLLEWTSAGTREVSAVDASLPLDEKQKRYSRYFEHDLADFRRLSVDEAMAVAEMVGAPREAAHAQSFWVLQEESRNIYVPAQVLIHALAGAYYIQRAAMFAPTGYQQVSVLVEDGDGLKVHFPLIRGYRLQRSTELTAAVLWASCFPSAQRMQTSVLRHALNGRLDIELPKARLTMSFVGLESVADSFLATRISLAVIEPLEEPLPHSLGLVPRRLIVKDADNIHCTRRRGTARKGGPLGTRDQGFDADINNARFATPLSDEEWEGVRGILSRHRGKMRQPNELARWRLDLILRKRSTGIYWTDLGVSDDDRTSMGKYLTKLQQSGAWDAVRAHLVTVRGGPAPASNNRPSQAKPSGATFDHERLLALRIHLMKMPIRRLATSLRVSVHTIQDWERGLKPPTPRVAQRLASLAAELLEGGASSVAWLLEEHGQMASPGD